MTPARTYRTAPRTASFNGGHVGHGRIEPYGYLMPIERGSLWRRLARALNGGRAG